MFRTPTLGFLLGDVLLILYNSGIIFEMSAMKVFMWNRMRKLGLQKSQKELIFFKLLPSSQPFSILYINNYIIIYFMYMGSRVS